MIEMETIEKTTWTSRPALKKMIIATAGNIAHPKMIEKISSVEKTFSHLWAKKFSNLQKR